ncbi:MAG: HlyC/CorC family transporter [Chloroflexi bacterium]|nr:HlyC/CorC family transporter [Chloroflexota bacterium]
MDPAERTLEVWIWFAATGLFTVLGLLAVAAQTALQAASRTRMRMLADVRVKGARSALKMLDDGSPTPTVLLILGVIGIGGTAVSMLGTVTTAWELAFPEAVVVAGIAGAVLVLVAVLCRGAAVASPERTLLLLGRPVRVLAALLLLVVAPLVWVERRVVAALGPSRETDAAATADDVRFLVESVEDARKLEEDEREMIHGIFGMSSRPVREVMVPRIDVMAMPRESTLGQLLDKIVLTGYSRIPIVADTIDNVVGLVYAKDVLRSLRAGHLDDPAEPIARAPYFVPDTKKVDELLQDLQQKRVHLAVVVDEYGGTAGIVSIEDLLEEIVGEIRDEYDVNEENLIQRIDARVSIVDARVSLRDVNEELDLHLDVDELDTLGGLVYHELGKVPAEGDEIRVNGCLVTVMSTQGRRIKKLKVTVVDQDRADEEEN